MIDEKPDVQRDRRSSSSDRGGRDKSQSRDRRDKRDKNPETYTQVYIAKLNRKTREEDLREAFSKYGHIKEIVLKTSYGFIDFDDHHCAEDAVTGMNGKPFINGELLVVEQSGREKN